MSGRRREARVELECVEIVHVHARARRPNRPAGAVTTANHCPSALARAWDTAGHPTSAESTASAGSAPSTPPSASASAASDVFRFAPDLTAARSSARCRRRRLRKVLLEHLHHLPGFEVDDVDRAARADRDENLAVRGEEEEVRARDPSRGALLLAKGPLLVVAAGRHLEKTEAMRVADGDEFACEKRGARKKARG